MTILDGVLITPFRLKQDTLFQLFSPRKKWLLQFEEIRNRDRDKQAIDDELLLVAVAGKKYKKTATLRPSQLALLYEATRFGHTVVVNSNNNKDNPKFYWRIRFDEKASDLLSVNRLWKNLSGTEAAHTGLISSDQRPESLSVEYGARDNKDSRSILMKYAKSSAIKAGLSIADQKLYLDNILALFEMIDSEARRGSTLAA